MEKKNMNFEQYPHEMSIEDFDRIDENIEKHVFSDRYEKRKKAELRRYRKQMLGSAGIGFAKIAVAAAVLLIATPVAVNAATNGELFQRLWGNSGKRQ